MPKSITDPTYVGSKAYVNYIKILKKNPEKIKMARYKLTKTEESQGDKHFIVLNALMNGMVHWYLGITRN